jgi:purine-binding chemotaxis protein CheW
MTTYQGSHAQFQNPPAEWQVHEQGNLDGTSSTNGCQTLVLFRISEQRYAMELEAVDRIIRAVAPTPVPETPDFVLGLINMAGQILPVISLRLYLGLPGRPLLPEDHFVIVRTSGFTMALVVDEVLNLSVVHTIEQAALADARLRGSECLVQGLVKNDGDIILIYDLEKLLEPEDRELILQATAEAEI